MELTKLFNVDIDTPFEVDTLSGVYKIVNCKKYQHVKYFNKAMKEWLPADNIYALIHNSELTKVATNL